MNNKRIRQANRRNWVNIVKPDVFTTIVVLASMTAGCVLVVHPDEEGEAAWQSDWESGESSGQRAYAPHAGMPGLAELVARSYGADDLLRDADVRVTARDDVVSLHGRVPSRAHFDRAVELALDTDGVAAVESRLTVEIIQP